MDEGKEAGTCVRNVVAEDGADVIDVAVDERGLQVTVLFGDGELIRSRHLALKLAGRVSVSARRRGHEVRGEHLASLGCIMRRGYGRRDKLREELLELVGSFVRFFGCRISTQSVFVCTLASAVLALGLVERIGRLVGQPAGV